ncbi:hypothetical protein [Xanthomonas citri]|uniref:hypothetical protein n=1 Tax=Xanthomonas citri TaxID=346 RepID=UPI00103D2C3A|nr:hypothetical protein [Xanthomonas citri]
MKLRLDLPSIIIIATAFFIYGGVIGEGIAQYRSRQNPKTFHANDQYKASQSCVDQNSHPS